MSEAGADSAFLVKMFSNLPPEIVEETFFALKGDVNRSISALLEFSEVKNSPKKEVSHASDVDWTKYNIQPVGAMAERGDVCAVTKDVKNAEQHLEVVEDGDEMFLQQLAHLRTDMPYSRNSEISTADNGEKEGDACLCETYAIEYLNDSLPFTSNALLYLILNWTDDPYEAERLGRNLFLVEDLKKDLLTYDTLDRRRKMEIDKIIQVSAIMKEESVESVYKRVKMSEKNTTEEILNELMGVTAVEGLSFGMSEWNDPNALEKIKGAKVAENVKKRINSQKSERKPLESGRNIVISDTENAIRGSMRNIPNEMADTSADGCFNAARRYFSLAASAYRHGDGKLAKELSRKGKIMHETGKTKRVLHSAHIFAENNKKNPENVLDFHGLFVAEAIQMLEYKVAQGSSKSIKIITGRGSHSINHISRLGPAIREWLRDRNIHFWEEPKGVINVEI